MAVPKALTVEEKRELVYAYVSQAHGSKARFLQEQGVTRDQMRGWRASVFAGTLEVGLVPRGGSMVSMEESAALARLVKQNRELEDRLRAEQAEHEQALAAKDADLATQRRAVDALGKAIEILHHADAGKTSQPTGVEDDRS